MSSPSPWTLLALLLHPLVVCPLFSMPQKLVDILNPHPSKTSLLVLLILSAVILATRKRILAHWDPHSFVRTFKIQMFMVLFVSKPFAHNDGGGWSGHETVLVFWVLILQLLSRCANWPWSYVLCFQKLPNPKDSALVTLAHLASR